MAVVARLVDDVAGWLVVVVERLVDVLAVVCVWKLTRRKRDAGAVDARRAWTGRALVREATAHGHQ